jgi:Kef-type K+ transport system membrane component KefB
MAAANLVSPLLTLLLQIVSVVIAARAMGGLFRRLGQPAVVGEMVAGLMLGPSLFGRIAPAAAAFLFPPASLGLLNAFSQFGIVLFMFIVGSRLESGHLLRHSRTVLQTSLVSMLLPLGLGVGLGYLIGPQFGVQESRLFPFVLFVGLSLSITAFPVLVRIVAEHDLTTTRLGTIAVACAAFDDVTAWVALALVSSLATTGNASVGASLGWLTTYALGMFLVIRPLLRWQLRRMPPYGDGPLALLVVAALASAAATEWIGIHALFGSFFLGALMARDVANQKVRTAQIEPMAVMLFVPLFFAFTGLRTNVYLLDSPGLALQTVAILVIAVLGKASGPFLSAQKLEFSTRETMALGVLLNTRGLVELVVINIGLEIGLLPPPVFAMLTLMALITTAMTSPLLTRLGYKRQATTPIPNP